MHILLTNDDGPLSPKASPYIPYLVNEIHKKGWKLSIVVPETQKSWIGKAHFAGKSIGVSYLYSHYQAPTSADQAYNHEGPFKEPQENFENSPDYVKWTLIDSTPAACVDIALNHIVPDVDLVILGPNFGKNSSNLYILASGTVGAAMEAALHEKPSIAISYSYDHHPHPIDQLVEASVQTVKVIEALWNNWTKGVECYSMNVPLGPTLKNCKAVYAPILENKWGKSIYKLEDKEYKWNPDFVKIYKDGLKNLEHSDNRVLLQGNISVTPLKAKFLEVSPLSGDVPITKPVEQNTENGLCLLDIDESQYIYECITKAFKHYNIPITKDKSILLSSSSAPIYHYTEYEDIDFDNISNDKYFIPSYVYRKALIRKHYLSNTIRYYVAKNQSSILNRSVPESFRLELDYAEFLDDSLDECEWMEDGELWILKPGMSDKGQGIRIFKTKDQLQAIFDSFETESDSEDEDEVDNTEKAGEKNENGVIISQLREFIIQRYIPPLLLPCYNNKKFHLRVYIVASGALEVWVNNEMLVLFADLAYEVIEKEDGNDDFYIDMKGHLTNSCLQEEPEVIPFSTIKLTSFEKLIIFNQVCQITRELFLAGANDKINFQLLQNSTEVFGVDFLVDDKLLVWLVEVNAYPDFKQTGDLKWIIDDVWKGIAGIVSQKLRPTLSIPSDVNEIFTKVLDLDN